MKFVKYAYKNLKGTYLYLSSKKYTTLAGTLAFFFILSLMPFIFWLTLVFGNLNIDYNILLELRFFSSIKELLGYFLNSAQDATASASILLIATTLYSSTNLFYHMRKSGEIIYDYGRKKSGILLRVSALVSMFVIMVTLFTEIVVFLFLGDIIKRVFHTIFAQIAVYVLLAGLAFLLVLILNLYICPYKINFKNAVWGSLVSVLTGGIASFGFSLYLHFGNLEKLYGAVSFFIVFLLWVYILMICFVIGAIINCRLLEKSDIKHIEIKKF